MTASAARAPLRRLSRSSRLPRCTSAPALLSDLAPVSDRASPSTRYPASINSLTTAEPTKPVPPVTNMRMLFPPGVSLKWRVPPFNSIIGDLLRLHRFSNGAGFRMTRKRSLPSKLPKLRADAQRNRERILEVATEAFTRSGADASLDDIAKQAGVGPGTLYRHFPTREELLKAVYRKELETLAAAAQKFAATLPPVEALRAWLLLFVDAVAAKQIIAPALNSLLGDYKQVFEDSHAVVQQALRNLVERGIKSGDIRNDLDSSDLLHALVGVANVSSSPDWQKSARRLVDILIAGSRPMQ